MNLFLWFFSLPSLPHHHFSPPSPPTSLSRPPSPFFFFFFYSLFQAFLSQDWLAVKLAGFFFFTFWSWLCDAFCHCNYCQPRGQKARLVCLSEYEEVETCHLTHSLCPTLFSIASSLLWHAFCFTAQKPRYTLWLSWPDEGALDSWRSVDKDEVLMAFHEKKKKCHNDQQDRSQIVKNKVE